MIQSAVAISAKKVFSSSAADDAMQVDSTSSTSEVQSSVNKENQTDTVMQSTKASENERGKRVLGVLMGTLNRFKTEESENSEATLKRALLEQRLAQNLAREKELLAETLVREQAERDEARNQVLQARAQQITVEVEQTLKDASECQTRFQKTQTLPSLFWAPKA